MVMKSSGATEKPEEYDDDYDIVISNVHIFDGQKELSGLYHVGVRGRAISSISDTPLEGRATVDGCGGWLMPGLIDTHVHFINPWVVRDPDSLEDFIHNTAPAVLDLFLEHGVTSIKSVGDATTEILELRAKLAAGVMRGPRLFVTGCGITGRDGHPASTILGGNPWYRARAAGEVDSAQMMRDLVHHLADRKVDAIKLLSEGGCWCPGSPKYLWKNAVFPIAVELVRLPTKILRAGVETAHERGLRVTVHTVQQDAAIEAVEAGADGLEHGVAIEPITDKALIDMMVERGITYTPTLWIHDEMHPISRPNTKVMLDAGVTIVLGSDSFAGRGKWGSNTIEEAELLVAAGLSPLQALAAGTSIAARHLDRSDLGTLAAGKRADMILLAESPLNSISNLRTLKMTILSGEILVDRR